MLYLKRNKLHHKIDFSPLCLNSFYKGYCNCCLLPQFWINVITEISHPHPRASSPFHFLKCYQSARSPFFASNHLKSPFFLLCPTSLSLSLAHTPSHTPAPAENTLPVSFGTRFVPLLPACYLSHSSHFFSSASSRWITYNSTKWIKNCNLWVEGKLPLAPCFAQFCY